ncbi:MAG: ATP-binding protein [Chloroflexi bacterium]|nr:ATP-binding protein [Chloroflexota bacterium]
MTNTTVRSIQTRLFTLLLRAFSAAVLFITLVILAAMAYFLTYPSSYNPIERLPIITRLETFYLVKNSWQGVEVLPKNDIDADYHRFWARSILLDAQGKVVLDHGSTQTALIGTTYIKKKSDPAIPILTHGKLTATLLFDESFFPAQQQLSFDFLLPIGMIAMVMAIPTIIIGLVLMRRFVTPLAEVIAAARAVAGGDLSTRVRASGPDDLRALSDSFNHMAASLEQSDSERRNMLADIAHELRTPLTVMRGRLEGIVDGIYDASPDQISPALEETYLLERLVEDLRLLTLAETRQLHFEHKHVNLGEVVTYVIDLFQAEADDKNIKLSFEDIDKTAAAMLDPQRIKQVVGNLVSNALRYTPEGGNVILTVVNTAGMVLLTISDDGPGVPAEDLSSIFKRFWRGEKSRSRASGGAGLGLAIARQLVEAQGGQIHAKNRDLGGLNISIQFPALT